MRDALQARGRVTEEQISRWREAAALMASLEAIGREGASVIVKIDGARKDAPFTTVISVPALGNLSFRKDGSDALVLLREAIEFYQSEVWSKQL